MWSFGLIVFQLVYGKVATNAAQLVDDEVDLPSKPHISDGLRTLLKSTLRESAEDRIEIS